MTGELELPALEGNNPLGFLAALGVLDVLHRSGRNATLRWRDDLVPTAFVRGVADVDDLVSLLDEDRERWHRGSRILQGPRGHGLDDVKPDPDVLTQWAGEVALDENGERADADLFAALLSEGGLDGKGKGKPTHLHFTTGQQLFLRMVRTLAEHVDAGRLGEAILGPWREDSPLPVLRWNSQGDRLYALRAVKPANDKLLGVPGADWLAFLGLSYYPTRIVTRSWGGLALETTGCDRAWESSAFRWPLWLVPLGRDTVRSLVGQGSLIGERAGNNSARRADVLRARGIAQVLEAPIRRPGKSRYGSFGGAKVLAQASRG